MLSSYRTRINATLAALAAVMLIACTAGSAAAETNLFAPIDSSPFQGVTDTGDAYEVYVKVYFKGNVRLSHALDPAMSFRVITSPDGQPPFNTLGPYAISGIWLDDNGETHTAAKLSMAQVDSIQQIENKENGKTYYYPSSATIKLTLYKNEYTENFRFSVQFYNEEYEVEDTSDSLRFCNYIDTVEVVNFCSPFKGQPRVIDRGDGSVEVRIATDIELDRDFLALYKELNGGGEELIVSGLDIDGDTMCTLTSTTPEPLNLCAGQDQLSYDVVAIFRNGEVGTYFLTYGSAESERFDVDIPQESEDTVIETEGCDDYDLDGVCDDVDNCFSTLNPDQADNDGDGTGDLCDDDDDDDTILDTVDNCPFDTNPDQTDIDDDFIGDVCDPEVIEPAAEVADVVMPDPQAPEAPEVTPEEATDTESNSGDANPPTTDLDIAVASAYTSGDCSLNPFAASGTSGPIALIVCATLIPLAIIRKR